MAETHSGAADESPVVAVGTISTHASAI